MDLEHCLHCLHLEPTHLSLALRALLLVVGVNVHLSLQCLDVDARELTSDGSIGGDLDATRLHTYTS